MFERNSITPLIVGIGGTATPASSTEQALNHALLAAQEHGCRTRMLNGATLLSLPHYGVPGAPLTETGRDFVDTIRSADGIILASPGYHGTVSGLVKNGIDYLEETTKDNRVYLDGLPVGLIATAYGWQAAVHTLNTLRTIVHALRGWPTPLGVSINSSTKVFKGHMCEDQTVAKQLSLLGQQVAQFAIKKTVNQERHGQKPSEQQGNSASR